MSNDTAKDPFRVSVKLFELGRVVATPGALEATTHEQRLEFLGRHISGDWGTVSAYAIDPKKPSKGFGDNTLWIITEADRSATTFLLSDEY